MNLTEARKIHKLTRNVNGMFLDNPIIKFGLALPFVVVGATSLKHSFCLSIAIIITIIPISVLAYIVGDKIPSEIGIAVYPVVASVLLIPVRIGIEKYDPVLLDSLGMYISLIAVSTLLLSQIDHSSARKRKLGASTLRSLYTCVGFSIVVIFVGIIRELFAKGTIGGLSIAFVKMPVYGISLAFFGFILLGFLMAITRWIRRIFHYTIIKISQKGEDK
ncbi:MAG: Rnf-Nqr domain containing protein [Oscillospiraceae bacterium]